MIILSRTLDEDRLEILVKNFKKRQDNDYRVIVNFLGEVSYHKVSDEDWLQNCIGLGMTNEAFMYYMMGNTIDTCNNCGTVNKITNTYENSDFYKHYHCFSCEDRGFDYA